MGEEAAAMDSIARAPPSALRLRNDTDTGEDPVHEEASGDVAPGPKRSTNNSKLTKRARHVSQLAARNPHHNKLRLNPKRLLPSCFCALH